MGKMIKRLSEWFGIGGALFIFPLIVITIIDVAGRNLLNKPIPGTFEISEYLLVIIIMSGLGFTQRIKGYAKVDFFIKNISEKSKAFLALFTTFLCILIVFVIIYKGLLEGLTERTVSDALKIPQKPFRLLVPIGSFVLLIEFFIDFIDNLKRFRK
uniref:TRAP transporter small permease n=1 Tax=candidate division WOR-3 bacterium TaxID=2052148 RepID=A0A7C2P1A9_UNCW3